jgi:hypothetical protein
MEGIDAERELIRIGCSLDDKSDENDEKPLDFAIDSLFCSHTSF